MVDRRRKNTDWALNPNADGTVPHADAELAVLMDIRDELKLVNQKLAVLQCPNFLAIPHTLKRISRNTTKKRKPRTVGKPKLRVVRS
jgi:hypothetical protein